MIGFGLSLWDNSSGAGASPLALYANGEPGPWISPSNIMSLFQDSIGTTPVTAYGQQVGLALDQSNTMALGPELISGSWTLTVAGTATATEVPAGTLNLTGDGTNSAIADMSIATVIGATYKLTASGSGSAAGFQIGPTQGSSAIANGFFPAGPNTSTFVATSTTTWLRFNRSAVGTAVVTTISARQVTHLGSERITNGAFPTDLSGWTQANTGASTVTWSAGVALFNTNGVDAARLRQSFPTVVGGTYLVSVGGTGINVGIGTIAGAVDIVGAVTTPTQPTFTFVATTTTTWFNTSSAINGSTLDNVTVRQIIRDGSEMNSILPWTLTVAGTATATESPTGTLNLTGDGTNSGNADKSFSTVAGATYKVSFTVATTAIFASVGVTQGASGIVAATSFSAGAGSFYFLATGATSWVRFAKTGAALSIVSNISVKLVAGAHASQPTSTKRPYYGQWPAQKARNLAQYSSDLSNAYWIKQAGASVAAAGVNTPLGNPAWTITYSAIDGTAQVKSATRTVVAGEVYTVSAWISAGTSPAVSLRLFDGAGTVVPGAPSITPTGSMVRYTFSAAMPNGGSGAFFDIRGSSVTAGTVIVGDIQWELSSTASAYQKQTGAGVYSDPLYRNLANGSADVGNTTYWYGSNASAGITYTKIGSGIDIDGLPYGDFTISGTASTTASPDLYVITNSRAPAALNQVYTCSVISQVIAGTPPPGGSGTRLDVVGETAPSTIVETSFGSAGVTGTASTKSTTLTVANAATNQVRLRVTEAIASGVTVNYTVRIKALQFELGTARTAYQANYSQYQVTEAGLPSPAGLLFDGVDDFLVTPTITPGTDKGQVFAGLRKLSDAARAIFATQQGTASRLSLEAPGSALNNYTTTSGGSTLAGANSGAIPAPIASVVTALDDISGVSLTLRVNGAQVASSAATQGTGNYTAGAVTLGTNGSSPFNGVMNEFVMRFGPNLTTGQITSTESYTNSKTVAY